MLSARNISGRKIVFDEYRLISEGDFAEEDRRTQVTSGDVLLTIVGAIGRTAVVPAAVQPFTLQRSVAVLKLRQGDSRFLSYALEAPATQNYLHENAKGTAQKGIYLKALAGVEVPVAPLDEQKRIANKLDAVLTRVDAVNTHLARVAPILKRFRQSVLAAATSGRLTEDWRAAHKAANWTLRTVDSLCLHISDGPFGSNLKSDDYTDDGARVVRLENIGHLSFDRDKKTYVSLAKYETLKKHTLVEGDLLFSSFVDEEVRVCEFPTDISEPTINKADCFCVRADVEQVNQRFLLIRLACKSTYEALKELVHGATRPRINLRQLRGFELRLPSLEEQTEIVLRVEILLDFVDRLEARLQTAQTATERLTPALLAKAFRGELVPPDPNDEPASELLQRLAARAEAPAAQRGRRKVTAAKV